MPNDNSIIRHIMMNYIPENVVTGGDSEENSLAIAAAAAEAEAEAAEAAERATIAAYRNRALLEKQASELRKPAG